MSGEDEDIYPYGECTWGVGGQVYSNQNIRLPGGGNAESGYSNAAAYAGTSEGIADGISVDTSIYTATPGDILCGGRRYNRSGGYTVGHVQYVISDNGTSLTITESGNDHSSGVSHVGDKLDIDKANPRYGGSEGPFPGVGVIHVGGGGGGSGHGETVLVEQTPVDYTGTIYECGVGTFGSQSGTQDSPRAPTVIHPDGDRENERGEPFIMYTDERTLTYTSSGQPVGSNGETVYTGSENFQLGLQPAYGNGGEMEGEDDG